MLIKEGAGSEIDQIYKPIETSEDTYSTQHSPKNRSTDQSTLRSCTEKDGERAS